MLKCVKGRKERKNQLKNFFEVIEKPVIHKEVVAPKESKKAPENDEATINNFELFRVRYPGTKRGLITEFDNFKKEA